jgi:hypothetical protein
LIVVQCGMDESYYKGQEKVFAVSAVFAKEANWEILQEDWRKILKEEKISYFKSSECRAVDQQFRKFRRDKLKVTDVDRRKPAEIRRKLLSHMISARMTVTGFSVDMDAFQKVLNTPEKLESFNGTPHYYCYWWAILQCADIVKGRDVSIAFGYDKDQQHGNILRDAFDDIKKARPDYAPHMATLAPFDDKVFIPIQVADLCASIIREYTSWKISRPRPSIPHEWSLLKKSHCVASIRVAQAAQLRNALQEMSS